MGTDESNCGCDENKDSDNNQMAIKVFSDACQVEEFLISEYFSKDEILDLGCWDICSSVENEPFLSNTGGSCLDGHRPITALAIMLLNQYSSLPRSIKRNR